MKSLSVIRSDWIAPLFDLFACGRDSLVIAAQVSTETDTCGPWRFDDAPTVSSFV